MPIVSLGVLPSRAAAERGIIYQVCGCGWMPHRVIVPVVHHLLQACVADLVVLVRHYASEFGTPNLC